MSTFMALVANTIRTANRPLSTALLVEQCGGTSRELSAICCQLMRRGWVKRQMRPNLTGGPLCSWWMPTPKLLATPYVAQPKTPDVEARLNAALDAGITSRADLADATGLAQSALTYALDRLIRKGELERIGAGLYARPLDDDGWIPQPYIHPYRARALGLTR